MKLAALKRTADLSSEAWLKQMHILNYKVFIVEPYNLNIVGWRRKDGKVNEYCDYLAVYFMRFGRWVERTWPAATRPGTPFLLNLLNETGAAILKPGQYLQAYELGSFKGYPALKQVRPVTVYRDKDLDTEYDLEEERIQHGMFGIHIHKSSFLAKKVNRNSAGCQVFQNIGDYNQFIDLCREASAVWGNKFTYTLLEF